MHNSTRTLLCSFTSIVTAYRIYIQLYIADLLTYLQLQAFRIMIRAPSSEQNAYQLLKHFVHILLTTNNYLLLLSRRTTSSLTVHNFKGSELRTSGTLYFQYLFIVYLK